MKGHWRCAAVDAFYDAQDHVGQADTNPEMYVRRAADAAARQVLEQLIDRAKTHGDSGAVEAMYALEVELGEDDACEHRSGLVPHARGMGRCPDCGALFRVREDGIPLAHTMSGRAAGEPDGWADRGSPCPECGLPLPGPHRGTCSASLALGGPGFGLPNPSDERYGNMIYTLEIERFGALGLSEMAERREDLRHAQLVHDVMEHLATLGPGDEVQFKIRRRLR